MHVLFIGDGAGRNPVRSLAWPCAAEVRQAMPTVALRDPWVSDAPCRGVEVEVSPEWLGLAPRLNLKLDLNP